MTSLSRKTLVGVLFSFCLVLLLLPYAFHLEGRSNDSAMTPDERERALHLMRYGGKTEECSCHEVKEQMSSLGEGQDVPGQVKVTDTPVGVMLARRQYDKHRVAPKSPAEANDDVTKETPGDQAQIDDVTESGATESDVTIEVGEDYLLRMAEMTTATVTTERNTEDEIKSGDMDHSCGQEYRLRHIAETCKKRNWSDPSVLNQTRTYSFMLVNDRRKVLYCFLAKSACTTFKTLLTHSSSDRTIEDKDKYVKGRFVHPRSQLQGMGVYFLNSFPMEDIQNRVKDYFKFLVVRHPFDRLLSAWHDKYDLTNERNLEKMTGFESEIALMKNYYKKIKSPGDTFWKNPRVNLTLTDYLSLVAKEYDAWFHNGHWGQFNQLCHPCEIQYDHVVKLETIDDDVGRVLSALPGPGGKSYSVPHRNMVRNHTMAEKMAAIDDSFRGVADDVIDGLMNVYGKDMELFGYQWDRSKRAATCRNTADGKEGSGSCC